MSAPTALPAPSAVRTARTRHYVVCPPTYFDVVYAINPWMDPSTPVDTDRALQQWADLVELYRSLGHRVDVLPAVPGLPDMVYAANGALVVDGVAYGSRFAHPQRAAEADHHRALLAELGIPVHQAEHVSEGEGDLVVVGDVVLAGTGFRTTRAAHAELAALLDRPVVTLELVDPRFYHLDTCLMALDDTTVAWFPGAFSPASQDVVRTLFPDAVEADLADALALGLNGVSRRPPRAAARRGARAGGPAGAAGLGAGRGGPVRAGQGRGRHQVLHVRGAHRSGVETEELS